MYVHVWNGTKWQPGQALGIDLTAYYTKTAVDEKLAGKANGDAEGNALNALQFGGHSPAWYVQSNPNLLINGNFQVWQRGLIFVDTLTIDYSSDRWMGSGNLYRTTEKTDNGIKLTATTSGKFLGIQQRVEMSKEFTNTIKSEFLTLSYSVKTSQPAKDYQGNIISTDYTVQTLTIRVADYYSDILQKGYYKVEIGIHTLTDGSDIPIGFSCDIQWAKLELGDKATPFVPRLYGEELALCQRYCIPLKQYTLYSIIDIQPDYVDFMIQLPVPMRVTPTIVNATFAINGGVSFAITAPVSQDDPYTIRCRASKQNHGLSYPIIVEIENDGAYLDAEL